MKREYSQIAEGIVRVECGLYRPGLVACYLLRSGDQLAFIDTGTAHTVPTLLHLLQSLGYRPEQVDYVIPTHVHLDHAGGVGDLMRACPGAKLVVHPKGAPHLIDPHRLEAGAKTVYGEEAFLRDFGALQPVPADRVIAAEDGQTLRLGDRVLRIFHTPGHANHHICIFDEQTAGLFSGDSLGVSYKVLAGARGPWLFAPTTPVAFDPEAWERTIDRLMALEPETLYLTHYGPFAPSPASIQGLRLSIRAFAEIALAEEKLPVQGRRARLEAAVATYLLGLAEAQGCSLSESHIRDWLAVDILLNAQGLEVWLARRAKRAGQSPSAGAPPQPVESP